MLTEFKPDIHYSNVIEESIIGICLLEPAAIRKTSILSADMFYFSRNKTVFAALTEMYRSQIQIDLLTAFDFMIRGARVADMTAYELSRYTNRVISSNHLGSWCTILKSMWTNRKIARINSVDDLKQTANAIQTKTITNVRLKHYRFLLTYFDRSVIKPKIKQLGSNIIAGKTSYKILVSSPLLVFAMHLIDPSITWTCVGRGNENMTNDECKAKFITNARFDGINWIDKTEQIPTSWL